MGRKAQNAAPNISSAEDELADLPSRPAQRSQAALELDKDQERREQEALARKITALQEFQNSDILEQEDELSSSANQRIPGYAEATAQNGSAVAASNGKKSSVLWPIKLSKIVEIDRANGRAEKAKSRRSKRSGSPAAPKASKQSKTRRKRGEPVTVETSIAIDPNLKEAEGVIHEAPITPAKTRTSRSKAQGANAMNAVLNESGSYVLVPSLQDDAGSLDGQHVSGPGGKRKGARPKQRVQQASEPTDEVTEAIHQDLSESMDVNGAAVGAPKPRGRGRPRKHQVEQLLPSAIPEKRKSNDASAETGIAEGAEGNGEDGFEANGIERRPMKQSKNPRTSQDKENLITPGSDSETNGDVFGETNGVDNENHEQLPDSGPLVKREQQILDGVMQGYREARGMQPSSVNEMIQNTNRTQSDETKELWGLLYDALPQRPRVSVMRAARRRYHNYQVRGKWSPADDEALRQTNSLYPGKWVKIGALLGRMPEDCRDRWRNYLACGEDRRTDDWSEKEERELKDAVEECAEAIRSEAKDRAKEQGHAFREQDWEGMVNFNKVSEKMNHTRSRLQCYTHWRVMQKRDGEIAPAKKPAASSSGQPHHRLSRALAKYQKMTPADKFEILNQIIASNPAEEESINWKAITRGNAGGRWTTRDRKEAWLKLKQLIEPQATLKDTLDTLTTWFTDRYDPETLVVQEHVVDSDSYGDATQILMQQEIDDSPTTPLKSSTKKQRKPRGSRKKTGTQSKKPQLSEEHVVDSDGNEFQSADEMPAGSNHADDDDGGGVSGRTLPMIYDSTNLYDQDIQDVNLARALQGIAQLSQMRGEHTEAMSNERAR